MKFRSRSNKEDNSDIYHWFFAVDKDIAEQFIEGTDRRIVCTVNGEVKYHCAIHADGAGGYRIMLNRERCKKLGLVRGEEISVEIEKDRSEYGFPIGQELREVLDQNPEADQLFHSFTKGMQRTLIYWVNNVKNPDIRIRRALVTTDHIVAQGGKPDHKLLNVEIKAANQAAKRM